MTRKVTYLLVAVMVAAGLAVSGVSACVCPETAACCGPACADGTHRDSGPAGEKGCCGGDHGDCAPPEAAADQGGADGAPRGLPCSCRASRRDPVLRKTGSSSDYDGLFVSALRADTALHTLFGAAPAAPVQAPAARRALHLRLCVWTC
ncbi:MAG: hypothetical protein GXY15_15075 [Candidatus Hydrogenedentes bacterium]|nr:hypothetical protein [Candidatus Hydrogenedentota bacterium]